MLKLLCVIGCFSAVLLAQTTLPPYSPILIPFTDSGSPVSEAQARAIFDIGAGTLRGQTQAAQFLGLTAAHTDPALNLNDPHSYVVINVVRWSDVNDGAKQNPASRWYIYNSSPDWGPDDFIANNRLFGVSRFWLVVVNLNLRYGQPTDFSLNYQITVHHRLPLNVQHLTDIIQLSKQTHGVATRGVPDAVNYWSSQVVTGANPPSDISIVPQATVSGTGTKLDNKTVTIDNEGLYHWDVSVGVPVKSYKQVEQITSALNGSSQSLPASVDRRNLLVLGDVYIKAIDLKNTSLISVPYLVGGVSFASKPLNGIMAGVGWGPAVANFYIGAMVVTSKDPTTGKKNTSPSLAFGLNLPIRLILGKSGVNTQLP
ncbi:MAG TPA: hypothetical protein VFQ00_09850 [Terriglobales bacterium]|nr:hypothetical protein [Terriglobales bacterium]